MMKCPNIARAALPLATALALAPVGAVAALGNGSRVGPHGVGPIVFGTTPAQAAATGTTFERSAPAPGSTCYYLLPSSAHGLRLMVEDGNIRRAELTQNSIATTDGFKVGDSATKLTTFYGSRAVASPDKYDPHAQTIAIAPKAGAGAGHRLTYKVEGGTVSAIVAGLQPQVDYVEGCS